jgi:hypothetical protein
MSVRTTVSLDEDVLERVKDESRSRGLSFKATLNDLLRTALLHTAQEPQIRSFVGKAINMGYFPHLNYDDVESLIEYGEGDMHR